VVYRLKLTLLLQQYLHEVVHPGRGSLMINIAAQLYLDFVQREFALLLIFAVAVPNQTAPPASSVFQYDKTTASLPAI